MASRASILVLAVVLGACSPRPVESAATPGTTTSATITAAPNTTSITIMAGVPSQSPADAARDGVLAEVAAAPIELRVNSRLSAGDSGWSWVVSELTDGSFTVTDYGELLLMEGDRIFRAFPSPDAPLSWMHLANEAVYVGHIGDEALPHSTIMRVDRLTLETKVWVFERTTSPPAQSFPTLWQVAADLGRYDELVGFGPEFGGLPVQSWVEDVRIDLDATRGLFNPSLVVTSDGLVKVEDVRRCGITCFDIRFRPTSSSAEVVYPLEMPLAEPVTLTVDCGVQPPRVEVQPVEGLDPAWDGGTTGCESVLAFSRWASHAPYFHLTIGDVTRLRQTPGPWAELDFNRPTCFGDPSSPPACYMGHESAPINLMTIESVTAEGTDVVISGVEWDARWVGEYVDHEPLGDLTVVVGCDTIVDAESERGEGWVRILDTCLLAQLFASGEAFSGIYAVYGENSDMIWGLDHVAEIELP